MVALPGASHPDAVAKFFCRRVVKGASMAFWQRWRAVASEEDPDEMLPRVLASNERLKI